MLKQKDIMDCLPLLASVLGNQYGVTVEIGGSEAYTDGKTIHLPALPLDSEPELITMIKDIRITNPPISGKRTLRF